MTSPRVARTGPAPRDRDPGTAAGDSQPTDRLISIHGVAQLFDLRRTAAYELTRRTGFPEPVVISARCYRWWEREVAAYAETLRRDQPAQVRAGNGQARRVGGKPQEATGRISGTVRAARGQGRAAR